MKTSLKTNRKKLAALKQNVRATLEAMKVPPRDVDDLVHLAEAHYVLRSKYPDPDDELLDTDVEAWCKEQISVPVFDREARWISCQFLYGGRERYGGLVGVAIEAVKRAACLMVGPLFAGKDEERMSFFLIQLERLLYEAQREILAVTGRKPRSPNVATCPDGSTLNF